MLVFDYVLLEEKCIISCAFRTPYVAVVFWYQVDEETAKRIDQWFKDGLFTFAVANSCVNPLVYGSHIFKSAFKSMFQRTTSRCKDCSVL